MFHHVVSECYGVNLVVDWRSSPPPAVTMGNLLRVLYSKDDSPAKGDIFVDFESEYFNPLGPSIL